MHVGAEGRVRKGLVFRSEALCEVPEGDIAALDRAGIRSVIDLRSAWERQARPSFWMTNRQPGIPVISSDVPYPAGSDGQKRPASMLDIYRRLPKSCAGVMEQLFTLLADGRAPLLIHCTAGKDRTGFVVAILLSALGARDDQIVDDYLRSAGRLSPANMVAAQQAIAHRLGSAATPPVLADALGVRADYLAAGLQMVRDGFGSARGYLFSMGVSERQIDAVKATLIEESPAIAV